MRSGLFWDLLQKNMFFQVGFPGPFLSLFIALFVQGTAPLVQGCEEF